MPDYRIAPMPEQLPAALVEKLLKVETGLSAFRSVRLMREPVTTISLTACGAELAAAPG